MREHAALPLPGTALAPGRQGARAAGDAEHEPRRSGPPRAREADGRAVTAGPRAPNSPSPLPSATGESARERENAPRRRSLAPSRRVARAGGGESTSGAFCTCEGLRRRAVVACAIPTAPLT